jgi:hypothetical protein
MDAKDLFLYRCEQLAAKSKSGKEIDALDCAAILRQLLLDHLLIKANFDYRLKREFEVGEFTLKPDKFTAILALEDGFDPETARPGKPQKKVNLEGLLKHPVLYLYGQPLSVRDVIKLGADTLGGVHLTPNREKQQKLLADYAAKISIGGLPGAVRQIAAISRVVLRGMKPLVEKIQEEKAAAEAIKVSRNLKDEKPAEPQGSLIK